MTQHCGLAEDYIVLYALDDLRGARREYVEAHISGCPECRRKVAEFQGLTRLLQQSVAVADDPLHRAHIKAQIAHKAEKRQPAHRTLWKPALLAVLILALTFAFLDPELTQADFRLGRIFSIITEPVRDTPRIIPSDRELPGTPLTGLSAPQYETQELPFQPIVPETLPLDLALAGESQPGSHELETLYANERGLTIRLSQGPTEDRDVSLSLTDMEVRYINGTEVLQLAGPDGAVGGLFWGRNGITFTMLILEAPYGGLDPADASLIVEALMRAQDAGP